ncbi:MAG: hypothetical protein IPN86_04170 [Saprospiraceae bacterium]|nr:hypothetical protein [Saprospiraceae bacterium]
MSKKTCKLCGKVHSENVGSHVFTESLIRLNFNPSGKRNDKEAIFEISTKKIGVDYLGRSVLPEEKEEILNSIQAKEAADDSWSNPYIDNDLVCRSCEKRFGHIESYFISNVFNKLLKSNTAYTFKNNEEQQVSTLFFLINIWRASKSQFPNFSFSHSFKETLGSLLNEILSSENNVSQTILNYSQHSHKLDSFSFKPYFLQMDESDDPTTNTIVADNLVNPHIFLFSRFLIISTEDLTNMISFPEYLPISNQRFLTDLEVNQNSIDIISNEERKNLNLTFALRAWQESVDKAHETLRLMLSQKFNYTTTTTDHAQLQQCIESKIVNGTFISHDVLSNCAAVVAKSILDRLSLN